MSDLAIVQDVQDHLGIGSTDTNLLQKWIDRVDGMFSDLTGQLFLKATTSTPVSLESVNGSGRIWAWVKRPITSLTTVLVGLDKTKPDETLTVSDPTVVSVDARRPRRIVRQDGSIFPAGVARVWVTYVPADNIPALATAALIEVVTFVYRRRGSEDALSERLGDFSHTLAKSLEELPITKRFLDRYRKPVLAMVGDSGGPVVPGTLWPYGTRFVP